MAVNARFTSNDWGKTEGIAISDGLHLNGEVLVRRGDGPEPPPGSSHDPTPPDAFSNQLRNHIVGRKGAFVHCIHLRKKGRNDLSFHSYVLEAYGQGPKGLGSGSMVLHFTDRTGDTYELSITRSDPYGHALFFDSSDPVITKIRWFHSVI